MDKQTYLAGYDDPEADMVIECHDGVKLRVHSYILRTHRCGSTESDMLTTSLYFRSMPAYSAELSGKSENKIDLNADSRDFVNLLEVIDTEQKASAISWVRLRAVIALGAHLRFLRLPELIRHRVVDSIDGGSAWEIFEYACQHDYTDLAKLAISQMSRSKQLRNLNTRDFPSSRFGEVPGEYVSAFLKALSRNPWQRGMCHMDRWAEIAKDFGF
jgi:hypothetical protein